jgi:hypothetical protein
MKDSVRALEALQAQTEFDVVEAGAVVWAAADAVRRAEQAVAVAIERCRVADGESRRAMQAARLNPALVVSLRRLSTLERGDLCAIKAVLVRARAREEEARAALAGLRNRQRSFERALASALAASRRRLEVAEAERADESWLQRRTRAAS